MGTCHGGVNMTHTELLICHVAYFKEISENVTMTGGMTYKCQHDISDDISDDGQDDSTPA